MNILRYLLFFPVLLLIPACSLVSGSGSSSGKKIVVLDIGHYLNGAVGTGAMSPRMKDGRRLEETVFWYQYSGYVKDEIEKGGYSCVVTNRGKAPRTPELLAVARKTPVIQLNRPDTRGANGRPFRYPSKYHPEHIAAGMISADFAIWKGAASVVFLHHDSSSDNWQPVCKSTILHNVRNGRPLAASVVNSINERILGDSGGKMPNNGKICRLEPRSNADLGGAAWLNTCDASGIPAIVVEAAMLNNPNHAYWLAQDDNAIRFARAVGKGVVNYLKASGK